ncbi:MAG: hypothetical protein A2275_07580 [Bacteroidetes bacterium RIFOXYA12_FULL_35_11]|nr:MAG: hypothetical protein A2X01_00800 [Bacteroidetes bacterium GWF2_35_48]OFY80788.1 MAG: hypothetical protein A2275_07580 [Bacteroidetes bacterium RIFOXYA12_FULL_35_11]OFY97071.1 MAG: hypothetical protein A2309_00550 [Bacteroidetes bacterium RIFOXYB2_FULL_35_7]OFZ00890.1 MAG: hypothetical protein A2491_01165 [Bacteroidetes bacterium RIFOXYC12_FULL_35_7]HBX50061.1 hypothetical protein [Bacteroidales bacterium]
MKNFILSIMCLVFIPAFLQAQSVLPLKKISIFKNSTCMVSKEGNLKASNNLIELPVPGQALLGSYWLGSSKDNSIKSITFDIDTLQKSSKVQSVSQIFNANIGKQVVLTLAQYEKSEKTASGKILDFISESSLIKIKTDGGKFMFIPVSDIRYFEFTEDINSNVKKDSIVKMAKVRTEKSNDNIFLQEYYMQLGMNWIPSYFLKIINDKEARLEMKAIIENTAEDLTDVETEVVVGSPQLFFGTKLDPMTYAGITPATAANIYRNNDRFDNNMLSNAYQVQTVSRSTTSISDESGFVSTFETEGEKNNDLYYYNLGKINLPKNTKGAFPIFANTLNYKDKYEASIPDKVNYASYMYCDNSETLYEVFHSIEIKNSTSFPFTTASVMVITEKNQFLAQDRLTYTPAGSTTTIKLSKAIDVILKNTEEESTRVDNFKKIGKTNYSKILLKGSITIENLQKKNVTVDVTKNVTGTVSNGGNAVVKKQKVYGSANPYSDLKWEVNLGAGEKKTLNYEYEVLFIPSHY